LPVFGVRVAGEMIQEEQTIEVEVVEIDGVTVPPRPASEPRPQQRPWKDWRGWEGRVRQLDTRWWPLWIVLGFFALVLLVAIGMCAAILLVTYKISKALVMLLLSPLLPSSRELQRR
jgi:hypothetical protein